MQKENVIGYTFYIVMTGGGRLLFYGGDDIVYFEDRNCFSPFRHLSKPFSFPFLSLYLA